MNHSPVIPALVMSALLAIPAAPAMAKSPILAIEISGDALQKPLRITDPDILGQFNYWNGPCCRVRPESMNPDPDMKQGAANTFMIYQGVEGNWLRSSAAWEAAVRPLIQASID